MKTIEGNIITYGISGLFDEILHGCNCHCNFGAGLAKEMKQRIPQAYKADLGTIKGDKSKLGAYSKAIVNFDGHILTVLNCYTQYNYGWDKQNADYDAIRKVFNSIYNEYKDSKLRFGIPLIGAGLAGGDWNIIIKIIQEEMKDLDYTIVKYKK